LLRDTRGFHCKGTIILNFAKEFERIGAMKYHDYEKAFSPARLYKYLKAFGGDTVAPFH